MRASVNGVDMLDLLCRRSGDFRHDSRVTVPSQVFSESVNHSGLQAGDTAAVMGSAEALRRGAVYADVSEGGRISLSLQIFLSSE